MKSRVTRKIAKWVRDMGVGAVLFLMLPVLGLGSESRTSWTFDAANAGEVIATRAIEVTAPPGPLAENAIMAAAQMRAAGDPLLERRLRDTAVLGIAFSMLVAFNLAFLRHLRRVSALSRRGDGRRRS